MYKSRHRVHARVRAREKKNYRETEWSKRVSPDMPLSEKERARERERESERERERESERELRTQSKDHQTRSLYKEDRKSHV